MGLREQNLRSASVVAALFGLAGMTAGACSGGSYGYSGGSWLSTPGPTMKIKRAQRKAIRQAKKRNRKFR